MSLQSIRDSILIECSEDFVGLWSIAWRLRNRLKETDLFRIRQQTMQIVQDLLFADLIQAGTISDRELEVWEITPSEIISRIESEWDILGREPDIGEIVWFVATEKGEQEAELLKQA
ncbi:hypothetical protein [Anthocerotibacter panamensis]|uniref:hypothetical protein n=1 Tax=Anthocerotibacter panamensis TaxID=2857077 RepID=UPI001C404266|nr:hypothetical protein [Anthocerotibacter panamensis]